MNAKKFKIILAGLLAMFLSGSVLAGSAAKITSNANRLYREGKFDKAIEGYDQALLDSPAACEPKFNKANSYFRLDDLEQASKLFSEVAAQSKDMKLVALSKYNLGNCAFGQGTKQKDSNPQKAIEQMQSAISDWRGVLDIDPQNQKAAKNIEVARLTIKDLLDQMKNQQDPNKPQDPNQTQQNQQQQNQQQQNQQSGQDPNKQQDPNQAQQQSAKQDPNNSQQDQAAKQDPNNAKKDQADKQEPNKPQQQQKKQEQKQQQAEEKKEQQKQDATAQEILDKEQRDKQQRQNLQRAGYRKVEKDW